MGIQENMSAFINAMKRQKAVSTTELSAELEISRSTLQEYLNGTGNPRAETIDHLAEKLGVDPVVMVSGRFNPSQLHIASLLLSTLEAYTQLPKEKQTQFAELFLQMLSLWDGEES